MNHLSWNDDMPRKIVPDMGVLLTESILDASREEEFQQKVQGSEKRYSPEGISPVEKHRELPLAKDTMQTSVNRNLLYLDVEQRLKDVSQLQNAAIRGSDDAMHKLQEIALFDNIDDIRVAAIEALGALEEQIPVMPLFLALRDSYWDVRAATVQVLGKLGKRTPIKHLIAHLRQEPDMSVREAIVRVLGQQGRVALTDVIVDTLLHDESWLVRETAAWALGELEEYAPLPALIYTLRSDSSELVRAAIATALGRTKRQDAMVPLYEALEDTDSDVQEAVSLALQQLDREVIESQLSYNYSEHNVLSFLKGWFPSEASLSEALRKRKEWQALSRLTEYIKDKRGGVKAALKDTDYGRVLLFQCFYERSKESLQETLLPSIQDISKVESIEAALRSRDGIVQMAVQKALEIKKSRNWLDLLVVSFSISYAQIEVEHTHSPLRVIVCNMGCQRVKEHDVLLLDQFSEQWHSVVNESLICEGVHDLEVWCQPVA